MSAKQKSLVLVSSSPEETHALGSAMGRSLVGGLVIGLVGPLGAGKTQLVKGIAAGNAIDDVRRVTSPTFVLLNEYAGRLTLYHLDAYRLPHESALLALGFDELVRDDSVVVVEWADRVPGAMPHDALWIEMAPTGPTDRELLLRAEGPRAAEFVRAVAGALGQAREKSSR